MKHLENLTTRNISLIAIFSALYYVLSFLPAIKFIGAGGVKVSTNIEAFVASIFGLVMGPYLGALTAFMGAFLAYILPPGTPSLTSAVFLPMPAINAFIVGLIYTRKWKIAFLTLAATVSAFWFLPVTQPWDQYSYIGFYAMWDKIAALAMIIPSAMLMKRMKESSVKASANVDNPTIMEKVDVSIVLSSISAVLILLNGWMIGSGENVKFQFDVLGTTLELKLVSNTLFPIISSIGYVWLSLGAGIIICAALLYFKPEKRSIWSASIFLLSCASVVIGGGFLIGVFLGVLGGIFGLLKRRFTLHRITLLGEMLLFFLLAFIGNEADNALGNVIFAVPFVYEEIFQIPLVFLRGSFIVAPFFYFAIRLLQASITTLIATPLVRNLKAAGFSIS
jgi:hypothetical protein